MKSLFRKEVLVLGLSLAALVCAAVALSDSLDQLENKEQES